MTLAWSFLGLTSGLLTASDFEFTGQHSLSLYPRLMGTHGQIFIPDTENLAQTTVG